MAGEHPVLPAHMDIDELKEELRSRRIGTRGERDVLERRLEEAWIKEGVRHDVDGEDGYAFGRHAVTAHDLVEDMSGRGRILFVLLPGRAAASRLPALMSMACVNSFILVGVILVLSIISRALGALGVKPIPVSW